MAIHDMQLGELREKLRNAEDRIARLEHTAGRTGEDILEVRRLLDQLKRSYNTPKPYGTGGNYLEPGVRTTYAAPAADNPDAHYPPSHEGEPS